MWGAARSEFNGEPKRTHRTSKMSLCALLCIAVSFAPYSAYAYPTAVRKACKQDYRRLCPHYKPGRSQMTSCMRASVSGIAPRCYETLVDHGYANRGGKARRY